MHTRTGLGTLAAVVLTATALTGCQQEEVGVAPTTGTRTGTASPGETRTTQAGASGSVATPGDTTAATSPAPGIASGEPNPSGQREQLSNDGGYIVNGTQITFVYRNGIRYPIEVGKPITGSQVEGTSGRLTLQPNGSATWVDRRTGAGAVSTVDQQGAGTIVDSTGAIVVLADGSTSCANAQGLQYVGADGSTAAASKSGAFFVDADGKKTTYGQPAAGSKLAGRFTVCNVGSTVTMDLFSDVLFDFDKATLTPTGRSVAASAAKTIKDGAAGKTVDVVGHTDSVGSPARNTQLGQQRADAVAAELRTQVPGIRLAVSSKGATEPVAANALPDGRDNPQGRAKNRRVTITYAR